MKTIDKLLIIVLISFSIIESSAAEESDNNKVIRSSDITVHGLELNEIVERISHNISSDISTSNGKYTAIERPSLIIWLVDNSSFLKKSKCPGILSSAINNSFSKIQGFKTSVVSFAKKSKVLCDSTDNLKDAVKGIESVFNSTDNNPKDPLEAIRLCVNTFKTYPHKKYLILFTIHNNDLESDLEETLSLLKENKTTLIVISGGAILSDPNDEVYGKNQPDSKVSRIDSAELELDFKNPHLDWWYPKGISEKGGTSGDHYYLHKYPYYNSAVLSGYGVYGLSRLAAYSGGKYYIYYPPTNSKSSSFCELHYCIWCDSKSKKGHSGGSGCSTSYNKFLPGMAPILISRQNYTNKYLLDPMYQLLLQLTTKSGGAWISSGFKSIFDDNGKLLEGYLEQIDKQSKAMDELIKTSEDILAKKGKEGDLRFEAHCAVALANLYIERFDLNQFKYFIEKLNVKNLDKIKDWKMCYLTPIFECLCHLEELLNASNQQKQDDKCVIDLKTITDQAIKAFIQKNKIEFYGGKAGEEELSRALLAVAKTIIRYKNTPWELVARRLPIIIKLKVDYWQPDKSAAQQKSAEPPPPIRPEQPLEPGQTPSSPKASETGN